MMNFDKNELATIYQALFHERMRDDSSDEQRTMIKDIQQKVYTYYVELDDAEKAAERAAKRAAKKAAEEAAEETYTNTDVTKIWVKTQKQMDDQTREYQQYGYTIGDGWADIRVLERIKNGTLWKVEIILDKNIKGVYCDEFLWLSGSHEERSHRAIYSNGERFFAKWYGKYIEVERGNFGSYYWKTVEQY